MDQAPETTTDPGGLDSPKPASPTTGRPVKLTPEIQQRLCDALRAGNTREAAAQYAGIARSTLYEWLGADATPSTHGAALRSPGVGAWGSNAEAVALGLHELADHPTRTVALC